MQRQRAAKCKVNPSATREVVLLRADSLTDKGQPIRESKRNLSHAAARHQVLAVSLGYMLHVDENRGAIVDEHVAGMIDIYGDPIGDQIRDDAQSGTIGVLNKLRRIGFDICVHDLILIRFNKTT